MNERFLLSWFSLKCFKDVFKLDRLSNRNLLQALILKFILSSGLKDAR